VFRRNRTLSDFSAEIESHLAFDIERLQQQGLSYEEARAAAYRAFGNVTKAQERFYELDRWLWWDHLWQDVRYSLRVLRKSPGFTLLAVLCLALGIGVNTSVFTLLDFALLRPLPVPDPQHITILSRDGSPLFSYADYLDYRDRNQSFVSLAASIPTESSLDSGHEAHAAAAEAVSANYAATMKAPALLGRWFTDEANSVAVLSYAAWRRFFHADPAILGRRIRSESETYTVIGVATPEFTGIYAPLQTDLWIPLRVWVSQYPEARANFESRAHTGARAMVFGRLKPGAGGGVGESGGSGTHARDYLKAEARNGK